MSLIALQKKKQDSQNVNFYSIRNKKSSKVGVNKTWILKKNTFNPCFDSWYLC